MDLARLRRMPPRELAGRGRQELAKRVERLPVPRPAGPDVALALGGLPARTEAGALVREHCPEAAAATVAAADAARGGRFDLLGYTGLSFGDPIDWHLDPVAGLRAPLAHWSRIDVLDAGRVGDAKVIWELNRHGWLVGLAQAYALTGDPGYAAAVADRLTAWLAANPRDRGIAWASSLELALRAIAWPWALGLVRDAPEVTPELLVAVAHSLRDHAAHVERHHSRWYAANTHVTGEALGLLYLAIALPGDRRATRRRDRALRILGEESERQILPDGAYFEQSTAYARYTADTYLHALILAERAGVPLPAAVGERVQRLLDFLLWTRHPDGSMPAFGDADGGWLLALAPRGPDDLRGTFSTAAAWFGRPDYAWAAGGAPAAETLWLLGARGLDAFTALTPAPPSASPTRLFADGGQAVFRRGWEDDADQLTLGVGSLADSGHAHADLLGITCAAGGEPIVVDPGTGSYADPAWRDRLRATAAHSTLTVDGRGQAMPVRRFHWSRRPRTRLRAWSDDGHVALADAEHDGYAPIVHRRRVIAADGRWLVIDEVTGPGEHGLEVRFQLAPLQARIEPAGWVRVTGRRGGGLLIGACAGAARLDPELREGEISPAYGLGERAPAVVFALRGPLPLRIATLLVPLRDPGAPPPAEIPDGPP